MIFRLGSGRVCGRLLLFTGKYILQKMRHLIELPGRVSLALFGHCRFPSSASSLARHRWGPSRNLATLREIGPVIESVVDTNSDEYKVRNPEIQMLGLV